jgi:type IV pilus assembly protein PilF
MNMLPDLIGRLTKSVVLAAVSVALNACSWFGKEEPPQVQTVFNPPPAKVSDEDKAKTNLDLGARYMDIGMLEAAQEKLKYALELDSGNSQVHEALGVLYERIGKDEDAEDEFEKALKLKPGDPSATANFGRFLCNKGQYDKGMSYLKQASTMPLNNRIWFARASAGICEYGHQNYQQAEAYLRAALQEEPNYAPALLYMAKVVYKDGQFLTARAFLERFAAVAPHTAESLWYAVQTERQLNNPKQAEEYRHKLLQSFPLSTEAKQLTTVIY